ncbi:hypothetical protein ACI4CD_28420, partial [Klebsiella pneumoniae]|uniref:hypothetical protein n=1 Tax=Klebsiella pneumoniae TaxID=573 RepID=UPI003853DFC8
FRGELLGPDELVRAVASAAESSDLAGLYAGGPIIRANRNSKGQRHWFATENFLLDYSLYDGPRAAKATYAGARWNQADWEKHLGRTRAQLKLLG